MKIVFWYIIHSGYDHMLMIFYVNNMSNIVHTCTVGVCSQSNPETPSSHALKMAMIVLVLMIAIVLMIVLVLMIVVMLSSDHCSIQTNSASTIFR